MHACMTTGIPLVEGDYPKGTIVVYQEGKLIGVLSPEAQENVKTIRMTFTREQPDAYFRPLQGVCVESF